MNAFSDNLSFWLISCQDADIGVNAELLRVLGLGLQLLLPELDQRDGAGRNAILAIRPRA